MTTLITNARSNFSSLLPLLLIALFGVGNVMFCTMSVMPQWRLHEELSTQVEDGRTALDQRAADASDETGSLVLEQQIEDMQTQLDEAAALFFTEYQVDGVLDRLYGYADASEVRITTLQAQAPASAPASAAYDVHGFRLEVDGSIANLMRFVSRIREAAIPSFAIADLAIQRSESGDMLTMGVLIYTSPYASGEALLRVGGDDTSLVNTEATATSAAAATASAQPTLTPSATPTPPPTATPWIIYATNTGGGGAVSGGSSQLQNQISDGGGTPEAGAGAAATTAPANPAAPTTAPVTATTAPTSTLTQTPTPTQTPKATGTRAIVTVVVTRIVTITPTRTPTPIPAPVANFSNTVVGPLTMQFTDTSTGSVSTWAWDFNNDGVIDSTARHPLYVFGTPGSYSVRLTVTGSGGSHSVTRTITVTPPAPVASFSSAAAGALTVQFTNTSTGSVTAWAWDFNGDSTTDSTTQHPLYTFAAPGTYNVRLTVTGPGGSHSVTQSVTVATPAPVASFSSAAAGTLTVQFTDTSSGSITGWAWDFDGNGTTDSTTQHPLQVYAAGGDYNVTLTVTGPGGSHSVSQTVSVTEPAPVAGFSSADAGVLTVQFTDASTGSITGWAWDFDGNGSTDSGDQHPQWTYSAGGDYNVTLTVTGPGGSHSVSQTVSVAEPAPVAGFGYAPAGSLLVQFTDNSTGSITAWEWDLDGDGVIDSGDQHPQWTYGAAGDYNVTLTVIGPGGSHSVSQTVSVS